MNNVLYINKPKGITSFDICFKLRKVLGTKRIGHTGTLDPNATGVMIILYDNATKANQFLVSDTKKYTTRVLFGIETDTLDLDGNIIKKSEYTLPDINTLKDVLNSFMGESRQEVPMTSAIKINGKKLYQYQLEGKEVEIPVRDINVYQIDLIEMYEDGFSFSCTVSSGTYVRALVRDILKKLDLAGTVMELRRDMIDSISIDDCDELEDVLNGNYHTHDLLELLSLRYKKIETDNEADIKNGKKIKLDCDDEMVIITHDNKLLAVYGKDNDTYRCIRGMW
ncbi:MAG: tRNA pseudouridine(55) synthase TruB [Erysipelotrichaceae bacterium]|nr:tRNA pseudouridine(55) synthase TruB [Erysipelotrichaceae bacterium]